MDEGFGRGIRNMPHVHVLPTIGANVYDILDHDVLAVTRAGVAALTERLAMSAHADHDQGGKAAPSKERMYQTILSPVVTEKATLLTEHSQVVFHVPSMRPSPRSRRRSKPCSGSR